MSYVIYELADPETGIPQYVGMTAHPKLRLNQHIAGSPTNERKNAWIQQLLLKGAKPIFRILETCESKEMAKERERAWILAYEIQGVQLTNAKGKPHLGLQVERSEQTIAYDFSKSRTRIKKYGDAFYLNELLLHPDYLNDDFADHLDRVKATGQPMMTTEEVICELEYFVLGKLIVYSKEEIEIVFRWYKHLFELGGLFEGYQPSLYVQ